MILRVGLLLICCANCFLSYSQKQERNKDPFPVEESFPTQDIHVSLISFLYGNTEVSYEYMPVKWFGSGLSLSYAYNKEHRVRSLLLPYFRYYLGNNPFFESFVEFNTGLVVSNIPVSEKVNHKTQITEYETRNGLGIGGAAGFKVTPYKNLLIELKLGFGRDLNSRKDPTYYLRPFISVGYRFVKRHHWNFKFGDESEVYD